MATRTWLGATDGDWGVTTNWSGSTVPINGDKVIFNGDGDVAVTAGLSQASVDLALMFIGDDFTKNIGTSSTRLQINATTTVHRGKGTLYLHTGLAAATTDEIIVSNTGTRQNLAADIRISNSDFGSIVVSRGRVALLVDSGDELSDLVLSYVDSRANDAAVTVSGVAGLITRILVAGGVLTYGPNTGLPTTIYVCSGKAVLDPFSGASDPTMHISCGGRIEWNNDTINVAEANVYDGILDFRQSREEKTATLVNLWPDGRFLFFPDLTTRTIKEWDGKTVDLG